MKTLEEYLKECHARGVIDHSIRARLELDGRITFYIHPYGVSGDTLDFEAVGNDLNPTGWATGA